MTQNEFDFATKFESGLGYKDFLAKYGDENLQERWTKAVEQVELSESQQSLLGGFVRDMKVIVFAGTWCGDCFNQCPILQRFEEASSKIHLRWFDRDDNPDLGELLSTCGAPRVPAVLFLSEDNFVCGRYGDRTLSRYRELAATQLGDDCPTGIGAYQPDRLKEVTQEWLDEFERIQLMLRLSGRLRSLHQD